MGVNELVIKRIKVNQAANADTATMAATATFAIKADTANTATYAQTAGSLTPGSSTENLMIAYAIALG